MSSASAILGDLTSGIRRLPIAAQVGLAFIALIVFAGIFAPLLTTHSPTAIALAPSSTGPGAHYWFGVDLLGRDVFSRLVAGTRRSLIVGFGSSALALAAGTLIGAVAATSRRAVDEILMRLLDIIMAFPTIVLAALLVVAYGKSNLLVLVAAIAFVFVPQIARLVRASVASQYAEDYVAAERLIGARRTHILVRHVARNCAAPILVWTTVMVANAIVFEASLSFIGAGLEPAEGPSSWGSVIAYGEQQLASHGWWTTFFAGLVILLTVLALNMVAEGIADVWAAPLARRRVATGMSIDRLETAQAGSGLITQLPGLEDATARLRQRQHRQPDGTPILSLRELHLRFPDRHRGVDIISGLSFDLWPGETLALVGESGSGKSLTALTIMGLQPEGAQVRGHAIFEGSDLLGQARRQRRALLGREMAMIYQDALSALNPAMKVRAQLDQLIRRGGTRSATELMELVGLDPKRTLSSYPHELSGGQRQRVVIAMALSRTPKLIIADEPTTALDVTVQAQIMRLLRDLRDELGFALILVSHDLALVSAECDRVVVMYGGQVAEHGQIAEVIARPAHHYARGLLGSVLSLESGAPRLTQIQGVVPSPADFPPGCRFADRCPMATDVCATTPALGGDAQRHQVACHHPAEPVAAAEPAPR